MPDPQQLFQALRAFIAAETWAEAQRIVETHPDLLTDAADDILTQLIAHQSTAQGEDNATDLLTDYRALLRRCREAGIAVAFQAGIAAAFAEITGGDGGLPPELAQLVAQLPPDLRPIMLEVLQTATDETSFDRELQKHPELLTALQTAAPPTRPDWPPQLAGFVQTAMENTQTYRHTGDRNALNKAVAAWEYLLEHPDFATAAEQFQLTAWNNAGGTFLLRYQTQGVPTDLDRALALWQQAVQATPPDSPDLPGYLNNLGIGLRDRYARTGRLEDLQEAIRVYEKAVQTTPPNSPALPMYLNNLGIGLRDRYARTGRLEDLQEAIRVYQQAVQATPPDSPALPTILNNLGTGLHDRYACTGRLEDLQEAIRVYQQAVQATPPDSPDLPGYLNNLGIGLRDRYARTGNLEDLQKAIRVSQQAMQATPPDAPDLPGSLNTLGVGLSARYARTGRLEDLQEAIRLYQQAVQTTPPDSPDSPMYLSNLGIGLRDRYARTGHLEDLQEAIHVYRQAVQTTPPDSPDLPALLNNLGIGLRDRYARTGHLEDLQEAIHVFRQAVQATPPDSPALPGHLSNLGIGMSDRYARTGHLEDLQEAIRVYRQAVQATPPDTPALPMYLNNLGTGLSARYARTGHLANLQEAIHVFRQAVQATPPDSPALPGYLNNLGNGLSNLYARTGHLEDLQEAIRVYRQAVQATPPDTPALPMYLSNLGIGLRDRYARTSHLEDLQEAIRLYRQAVQATPSDSPALPGYLNNLGNGLSNLYARAERTGGTEDLQEAIRVYWQAVQATPPNSPDLPGYLNNLGTGLSDRYAHTECLEDLQEAIRVYRQACETGLDLAPEEALRSGRNWGQWAFTRRQWDEAVKAFNFAIQSAKLLVQTQYNPAQKRSWLKEMQAVPAYAAYVHAKLGHPAQAVETLEQGRAQLLREGLERNRRDLAQLPALGFETEYNAYRHAVRQFDDLQALAGTPNRPEDWLAQIEAAQHAVQAAVQAIRDTAGNAHPQFRHFMESLPFADIQTQAQASPLVYLLATSAGGLALIVHPGGVKEIWLDELTEAYVNSLLLGMDEKKETVTDGYLPAQLGGASMDGALAKVLPALGEKVMAPLAAALHALGFAPGDDESAPAVTLIPDGRLALFPLHAAQYSRRGETVHFLDEFSVSYAISAQSLAEIRRRAARRRGRPLRLAGVGNPLPTVESLRPLHKQLQAAVAALPDEGADTPARRALAELVALPTEKLRDEGFDLWRQALKLPETAGKTVVSLAAQWPRSLRYGEAELRSVVDLLPPQVPVAPLYREDATAAALQNALPEATLLHFSCHGSFNPDEPLQSGLQLAGDDRLTLHDLLEGDGARLAATRLVTLSACQTAISDFSNLPNESLGLPGGLLEAGAPAVIGTLWSVDDAGTALLMVRVYELILQEALSPPRALRRAQRWLRTVSADELDDYLAHHEAIALARRQHAARMPLSLINALAGHVDRAPSPDAPPFAASKYWAPFVFFGNDEVIV